MVPSPPRPRRAAFPALAGLALLALQACAPARAPRPDVLLITIDTLRADHLGCYGYTRPTSPRIDRLAAAGTMFTRVTASLPRTTQSIASILTGRHPRSHGARGLFESLPAANLTLAEILRDAGYTTGAVVSNMFLRPGQGFEQGFDSYDNPPGRYDGDSARDVTEAAVRWLRAAPADRPCFLWVHYLDPHWTYLPGPPLDRAFDPGYDGRFTLYDDLQAGRLAKGRVIFRNPLSPRDVRHVIALYDGEIAQVDAALGPLLDEADRRAGRPPLVVLTSDHGESLGEHGYFFAHGEYLYEPGLHVPLIVSLPGAIPAGLSADGLAQNIDVAPTILSILGIDRLQGVDGRPLFVRGGPPEGAGAAATPRFRPAPGRTVVLAESDFMLIHKENPRFYLRGPAGRWTAASDGRHKLIQIPRPGGEIVEIYDLQDDPGETRDLERAGVDPEIRRRLLLQVRTFADYETGPEIIPDDLDPEQRQRLRSLGYVN